MDDYEESLTNWLLSESRRHRKQRRTVKRLYHDLVELGYTGSYDRVAAFARQWRQEQQAAKAVAGKQGRIANRLPIRTSLSSMSWATYH